MTSRELKEVMAEKGDILEKYLSTYPVEVWADSPASLGVGGIRLSSMRTGVSGQITNGKMATTSSG